MVSPITSQIWSDRLAAKLGSSPEWARASAYFSGCVGLQDSQGTVRIGIEQSKVGVVTAESGSGPDADFVITGPDAEWKRVLEGDKDLFQALNPEFGRLTIEGDAVAAMRNIRIVWLIVEAMAARTLATAHSPELRSSGRGVIGRYIMVDGVRTYYEEAGDGPPLVCFHAACQDSMMYRHVLDQISDAFRVIAVDAPAHGKSLPHPTGVFNSLTQHARFNEMFVAVLGLERPVIMGCSMGGNLVLEMGSRRPDDYAAIVSAEGADFTPTLPDFLLDMLLLNGQQILEGYARSLTGTRTPPDRAREVTWQLIRATPEVMRGDLVGYAGFDQRDGMANIAVPVLLLRGAEDWLVSQEQVELTASRLADCQIAILGGTGHYPMIENPVEFNAAIRAFLNTAHSREVS